MENNQKDPNMDQESQQQSAQGSKAPMPEYNPSAEQSSGNVQNKDVEENKPMAIIGYILPILFFIPLLTDAKESPFAKFHANQQLVLLITGFIINVVGAFIPILGWFLILPFGGIFVIVIAIMGIINAAQGKMKKLPLVGGFEIIK